LVAERCGLPSRVVGLFESLFFAVCEKLRAHDWILIKAIWTGRFPTLAMPVLFRRPNRNFYAQSRAE
jgi:hypothetical protein